MGSGGRLVNPGSVRLALGLLVLFLATGGPPPAAQGPDRDIVEILRAAGPFTTLLNALEATGLRRVLTEPGPFTLLAPTDDAFARLSAGEFALLLSDPERLVAVLERHIVAERLTTADLARRTTIAPLRGASLHIAFGAYGIKLDGVSLIRTDLAASNGVIHVIDAVLLPR
jgi:uncharacterized surface protein with fasciclin (FAS1) repeats